MLKVVLIRHSESVWNKKHIFTGWTDVDLSKKGLKDAKKAGRKMKEAGLTFDMAYTSVLKRSIRTLWLALDEMDLLWLPVTKDWRLNERHYGGLMGKSKPGMRNKVGKKQVHIWRRSFSVRPPKIKPGDKYYIGKSDPKYKHLKKSQIPLHESLEDTIKRVLPYWQKEIVPKILDKQKLIISAHGNSLRALVKELDNISDQDIPNLEIKKGVPLIYEFTTQKGKLKKKDSYYLY